jgi:cysteine-rich CWC protein
VSEASCVRCGAPFHCGVADAEPCWCAALTLDAVVRADLAERYIGCLCAACLAAEQAETAAPHNEPGWNPPSSSSRNRC